MTGRVLITGASGFIGRQAVPLLRERGFEVHAPTHAEVDLLDAAQRAALIASVRPTHVLHFAWIATPGVYWTSPLNAQWQAATVDLLSLCVEHGVQRFVGAGTCAEYDWSVGHCIEGVTPLVPATPYGQAKVATGEAVIVEANMSTAWGRIFHLYGPNEHPKRLVSSVILSLLKGETAKCTHGMQVRDLLHVRDVASAFVALLESDVRGAVNIASGAPVTLREVVETIAREIGRPELVTFGAIPTPANDPPRLTAEVARLEGEVGWKPSYTLETGIADAVEWWRSVSS